MPIRGLGTTADFGPAVQLQFGEEFDKGLDTGRFTPEPVPEHIDPKVYESLADEYKGLPTFMLYCDHSLDEDEFNSLVTQRVPLTLLSIVSVYSIDQDDTSLQAIDQNTSAAPKLTKDILLKVLEKARELGSQKAVESFQSSLAGALFQMTVNQDAVLDNQELLTEDVVRANQAFFKGNKESMHAVWGRAAKFMEGASKKKMEEFGTGLNFAGSVLEEAWVGLNDATDENLIGTAKAFYDTLLELKTSPLGGTSD